MNEKKNYPVTPNWNGMPGGTDFKMLILKCGDKT
jgi:hypothetical protein